MQLSRILIVDDRQFDRLLYKEYLGEENYEFAELDDGEKIVSTAIEYKPNLVLLDWQMPCVGGLEALRMLKKNKILKNIPVIIITGLEDEKVLENAFDFGSVDFINKPISKIELNSRVHSAIHLAEAIFTITRQKNELNDLNIIISKQKMELEKSLNLKTEQLDQTKNDFEVSMNEKNKKLMGKEIDSTKLVNEIKNLRQMINDCRKELRNENENSKVLRKLQMVERNILQLSSDDDSLDDFKEMLESVDPVFYKKLSQISPNLTPNEMKNCAFIKMNLDNYEVSRILNVELKSLQMTRYRLKKKFNLNKSISLREFIHSV